MELQDQKSQDKCSPSTPLKALGLGLLATLASCTSPKLGAAKAQGDLNFPEIENLSTHTHERINNELTLADLPFDPSETFANMDLTELSFPSSPTIEPIKLARVYVANGAFLQERNGSASNWMAHVAETINQTHDDFEIDVSQIKYTERNSIAYSSQSVLTMITEDLKKRPLGYGEEIVLMGHSQGALILSYAMHQHERDPGFFPDFPWGKVRGLISIDVPLKVLKGYEGPYEKLVDPLSSLGRKDPIVIPLVCAILYPSANDYLGKTEVLEMCKNPADGELRLSRTYTNGKPVQINVPPKDIDNPESLWSHHLFAADLVDNVHEKDAREKLLKMCLELLKVDCLTDTP